MQNSFYTFKNGRKCRHCNAAISDQSHLATIFCPRVELPDGSIKSCKDDYHWLKNKEINSPYQKLSGFHKDAHQRIEKLLSEKGDTVTTEQVNQYGIRLDMPVQLQITNNQKTSFYFIGFCLTQISQSTLKISTYENIF